MVKAMIWGVVAPEGQHVVLEVSLREPHEPCKGRAGVAHTSTKVHSRTVSTPVPLWYLYASTGNYLQYITNDIYQLHTILLV